MTDWKENFQGFAFQRHHEGWEGKALTIVCALEQLPYRSFGQPLDEKSQGISENKTKLQKIQRRWTLVQKR